ncbi:MAG: alanine racemase [Acidimicrobiia bacterium]|nr:alanine racemase [Acidimicrobiia bacterium]
MRPTSAIVDLAALQANAAELARRAAPAGLCAVVKADGYGHGAVATARAALAGGATWLAVALVEEGIELRQAGVTAPILLLSEPRPTEMVEVVAYDLRPSVYSATGLAAAAAAATTGDRRLRVHLKVDTGMNRVGAHPDDVALLASAIEARAQLHLEGVWTHCAVADELGNPHTDVQLERYEQVLKALEADLGAPEPGSFRRHAANSALLLAAGRPDASPIRRRGRYDMVRAGIALYGLPPSAELRNEVQGLRPVMQLQTQVSFVKSVAAGEGVSYGLAYRLDSDSDVATLPIGYADGVRRDYGLRGGAVLIRGRRRPVVGVVTMDQLMVDCGQESDVSVGDEAVLIGTQGDQSISAADVADSLGTIPYEVVCDVGRRVRRHYC